LGWSLDPDGNIKARWMVTTPTRSGYRTRLTGLLAQKYFSGLYAAKDRGEA
jgi:hypothetical protein